MAAHDFSRSAIRGVAWMAGLTVFRDVLQFGVMLVLTRMLAPAVYGQYALVMAIIGACNVLSFRPFLEYALQQRDGEPDFRMHFSTGLFTQSALFAIVNAAALWLRGTAGQWAEVAMPLHVMSLLFLIDWPGELRVKMLERSMEWGRLRVLQGIALAAGSISALVVAWAGGGIYALLVQALVIPVPPAIELIKSGRRARLSWSRDAFAPSFRYGIARIGSGLTIALRQALESGVLARYAGFGSLGLFSRASGLANLCCLKIPSLVTLSLFPMLARLEPGSRSNRRATAVVLRVIAWSVIPAAAILSLAARPVIRLLYGENWLAAAPMVPWALASAGMAALSQTASALLLSSLQQRLCLYADLLNFTGTAICLWWLLPRGMTGYLAGVAAVNALCLGMLLGWLLRGGNLTWGDLGDAFLAPVAVTAFTFALPESMAADWILIALLVVAVYAIVLRVAAARPLRELISFIPGNGRILRLLWLGGDR